jgi:predicted metalloprotease with PDZ domain
MINYTLTMPAPHSHLFHVAITVDAGHAPTLDLVLPAWTPGSYMIREYARHVQRFAAHASDGSALPWRKISKDTWQIERGLAAQITVTYELYANELTVRTSHLDDTHGYCNGACVFMAVAGRTAEPLIVRVEPPAGWIVTTALEPLATEPLTFQTADYDELVDSPIECGTQRVLPFEVDGIAHRLAIWGHGNEDEGRLVADTRRIVEVQRDFFGSLPYPHYTIILHLTDGRSGGLEHRNSVTNMLDRWTFQPERNYERYLSLTSHELFHVWNVKRLRPAPLGPFDYQRENYTRLLWLMEGATSYYDELLLVRAGLLTSERYLENLAESILMLQSQPGRQIQSVEQSSFDAWIKLYRPDENSANSSISYYLKGSLVCLLLDMLIRAETANQHSFDDVLRLLYVRYPSSGPGIPEDGAVLAAVEEVAGNASGVFRDFFARAISGTSELDYAAGLATVGLTLRWGYRHAGPGGAAPAWLGLKFKRQGERTLVASVRSDGPAYEAGVYADDELLAINGWRVNEEKLNARLAERAPGDLVTLTLFRGDRLINVPVSLAAAPYDQLRIVPLAAPSSAQQVAYQQWVGQTVTTHTSAEC